MIRTFVVLALLVAACGSAADTGTSVAPTTTTTAPTITTTAPTTTTAAPTTTTTPPPPTTTTAATTTTTSVATTTTTTTTAPPAVTLTREGISAAPEWVFSGPEWVYFGLPADEAVAAVSAVLDAPDEDSGWVDALSSPFGVCPPPEVRVVRWGGLSMFLTTADTDFWLGGVPHFFAFSYTGAPPAAATPEGITVGSTVAELRAAYGPDLALEEASFDPSTGFWSVLLYPSTGLWGYTTGLGDDDLVTSINGGSGCGE